MNLTARQIRGLLHYFSARGYEVAADLCRLALGLATRFPWTLDAQQARSQIADIRRRLKQLDAVTEVIIAEQTRRFTKR